MTQLSKTVANGFATAFRDFARKVRVLSDPLSDEQWWRRPYPYGNSLGHLTLHLIGNLSYYIGAQIAQTGYVRQRDLEFTDSAHPPKEEVLGRLDATVEMVVQTIEMQSDESWSSPYSALGAEDSRDRFAIVLRCASHFHHHLGQMIYLAKEHSR